MTYDDLDYSASPSSEKECERIWRAPVEIYLNFRGEGYAALIYGCIDCGQHIYGGRDTDDLPPSAYCYWCAHDLEIDPVTLCSRPRHSLQRSTKLAAADHPSHSETVTGRVCEVCGVNIDHLRPQAKTCSAKCRKARQRLGTAVFS